MVTIRDVAKKSGFSMTAVSMVLNDAPLAAYIPQKTKNQIRKAAEALGYRPNLFLRSLRSKRTGAVGVIVFDITSSYCAQVLRGISTSLYQASYVPIITDLQNDPGRFTRLIEMLLDRRVDGLITLANSLVMDLGILSALEKHKIPCVTVGREIDPNGMNGVVIDNAAGSRAGIEHLYGLGHRRIAFIRGPRMLADSSRRWKGIRSFARDVGLNFAPELALELPGLYDPSTALEGGYKATQELLRRKLPFTAIMAFDDLTALGAMRCLSKGGLKVPEDCAVIGFDDIAAARLCTPSLTTVHQPMVTMGSLGVGVLMDAIDSSIEKVPFAPVYHKVPPVLIVRESTKAIIES